MMELLLTAINAKYIHSNLAVYCLKAYADEQNTGSHIRIAEYTINHSVEHVLGELYRSRPEVLLFSCYIWNIDMVCELITEFHKISPLVPIWVGGPEVSYDAVSFLLKYPQVTGVMTGEGEKSFTGLARYYGGEEFSLSNILGITYRNEMDRIIEGKFPPLTKLDEIPFPYKDLTQFENRILYYESSRGCPYSCSYCLSSIDKQVRYRSLSLVFTELAFFLKKKVRQVKFVDRTFNCNHRHALAVWSYILEHDNGVTNFHFEISADLLTGEELALLARMRPGLVQLEIGVQSTNIETIREIDRRMNLDKVKSAVDRLKEGNNIHLHLDLIAGLPKEDLVSFAKSFNTIYSWEPHQLQLGFLKVLKGSKMQQKALDYGIVYRERPPYEVLFTSCVSYEEMLLLKEVEAMVEVYYNSNQFVYTMRRLIQEFESPFLCYKRLAEYYINHHLSMVSHSRLHRYEILLNFICESFCPGGHELRLYQELLIYDLYLRENLKSRPKWAQEITGQKERIQEKLRQSDVLECFVDGYQNYSHRQIVNMTHVEAFHFKVDKQGDPDQSYRRHPYLAMFNYQKRSPLTSDADVVWLEDER